MARPSRLGSRPSFSCSHVPDKSHEIFESEWAIPLILCHTDPRTVCRLACLNTAFRAASQFWPQLLPGLRILKSKHGWSTKRLLFLPALTISPKNDVRRYSLNTPSLDDRYKRMLFMDGSPDRPYAVYYLGQRRIHRSKQWSFASILQS